MGSELTKNTLPPPPPHTHLRDFSSELNQEYPTPQIGASHGGLGDLEVLSSTKNICPHLKVRLFMQDFGTSVLSSTRNTPPTPQIGASHGRLGDLEVLSSTKNIYPYLKVGLFMQDFGTSVLSLPRIPPTPKHFCRKFVPLGDLEGVGRGSSKQQAQGPKTPRPITVHFKKNPSSSALEVGMWYLL